MTKLSHAAGWAPDSPTPAQFKEFFAQVGSNKITKQRLQEFLGDDGLPASRKTARRILGDDIIFPDEIANARGLHYTQGQLQYFAQTIPSQRKLQDLKADNLALIAGPPSLMDLCDVRQIEPRLFSPEKDSWYIDKQFGKVKTEWLAIHKKPVANPAGFSRSKQIELLMKKDERMPNASEISWFLTTFFKVRRLWLLESTHVWTCSTYLGLDNSYIVLAHYAYNLLYVDCFPDGSSTLDSIFARNLTYEPSSET